MDPPCVISQDSPLVIPYWLNVFFEKVNKVLSSDGAHEDFVLCNVTQRGLWLTWQSRDSPHPLRTFHCKTFHHEPATNNSLWTSDLTIILPPPASLPPPTPPPPSPPFPPYVTNVLLSPPPPNSPSQLTRVINQWV